MALADTGGAAFNGGLLPLQGSAFLDFQHVEIVEIPADHPNHFTITHTTQTNASIVENLLEDTTKNDSSYYDLWETSLIKSNLQ